MKKVIAVIGTLDTKGYEHKFVSDCIKELGFNTLLVDLGTFDEAQIEHDVTRFEVAKFVGLNLKDLMKKQDRGECVTAMSKAAPIFVKNLLQEGKIDGIISLGGGGGTALGTAIMRALPLGFPKIMVSTLASGQTAHYIGVSDIIMIPSIIDVAGLNKISKEIFYKASRLICTLVNIEKSVVYQDKPMIAASMFGNTTQCIQYAKNLLENQGFEVLVFHATGIGGKMMENLILNNYFKGIYDITTTEWADEFVGGTLSAGKTRLDAGAKIKIPTIIAPGCLDMVNFGEYDSIPQKFQDRDFYIHNPQVTLMRTNKKEAFELGKIIAEKANLYPHDKVAMALPIQGISVISRKGQDFYDKQADKALFEGIKQYLSKEIELLEIDDHINSEVFAKKTVNKLLNFLDISIPNS